MGGSSAEESEGSRLLAGVHQCAPPGLCPHTQRRSSGQTGGRASPSQGAESEEQRAADTQPHSAPPPHSIPTPAVPTSSFQGIPCIPTQDRGIRSSQRRPGHHHSHVPPWNGARNQPLAPLGVHRVSVPGWTAHPHVGIRPPPVSCHVVQNPQARVNTVLATETINSPHSADSLLTATISLSSDGCDLLFPFRSTFFTPQCSVHSLQSSDSDRKPPPHIPTALPTSRCLPSVQGSLGLSAAGGIARERNLGSH